MKPRKRGRGYLSEPKYKIPDELPLKIALLALIAMGRGEWEYEDLDRAWFKFCPHPKSYNIMVYYIVQLKRSGCVEIPEKGRVKITKGGIMKLRYYDKKVGFPEVLRERIKHLLGD